jgi:hypothetical protein
VVPQGSGPAGAPHATVTMTSLDSWSTEHPEARPTLIKIDVEGHELEVLAGARALLGRFSPVLIIEVNDAEGLEHVLGEIGYQAFELDLEDMSVHPTSVMRHAAGNVLAARDPDHVARRLR